MALRHQIPRVQAIARQRSLATWRQAEVELGGAVRGAGRATAVLCQHQEIVVDRRVAQDTGRGEGLVTSLPICRLPVSPGVKSGEVPRQTSKTPVPLQVSWTSLVPVSLAAATPLTAAGRLHGQ